MAKENLYGIEARNALTRGVDKLADTVKITIIDMSEVLALGVPVGDGITVPNTTILDIALFDAANKREEYYTPDSWQALQEAVTAAEQLIAGSGYTQEDIDLAYETVMAGLSALVAVPGQPSNPQAPNDGENETTDVTVDETETTAPGDETKTDDTAEAETGLFGCGGMVNSASFCLLFALIPTVFKKKKFD